MKNSFTVTLEFSYKGETYQLKTDVDLDECMEKMNIIPPLHDLIARRNGIDTYSYQYEILTSEELQFSQVKGFAADFIHGSEFDAEGFAERWREDHITLITARIAHHVMGIADLSAHPALRQALLEAFCAGQSAAVVKK